MNQRIRRLALGTVQFGLDYGIASSQGQTSAEETQSILAEASRLGIDTLDTAAGYGDCEAVLGKIGVTGYHIITKVPSYPDTIIDIDCWVLKNVRASLDRLGVKKVYGVLLHQPGQLLGVEGRQLYSALVRLKSRGLTQNIGISVYAPEELDALCNAFDFDLVQAPLNILDRRLVETGWVYRLRQRDIKLHVRSVFLQGLLLMDFEARPLFFENWNSIWDEWHRWLTDTGLTPLEACLRYVYSINGIDRIIVGVDNLLHLQQIVSSSSGYLPDLPQWPDDFDISLLNPKLWNQN